MSTPAADMLGQILGGLAAPTPRDVSIHGTGSLPAAFAVSDLAAASIAAAGAALAGLLQTVGIAPAVAVDRRLASFWFGGSLRPEGWSPPPPWDPVAGDYEAADGWIRLHTNATRHRNAALTVLGVPALRDAVADAVARWPAGALEDAIVAAGGCVAAMRSADEWAAGAAGTAVAAEPLIAWQRVGAGAAAFDPSPGRKPLQGLRVLDMTRVLAGPVATRLLALMGADVLRIDPPEWEELGVVPEVMMGKRSARVDARSLEGRERIARLFASCHVFVHGYRPGALEDLGFGGSLRRSLNPTAIEVTLDAYGWTGPWRGRRGFDSLVQMSTGIAEAGMRRFGKARPTPLPVQALDHATGYLMAAAALSALTRQRTSGETMQARLSLARTAALLMGYLSCEEAAMVPETPADSDARTEATFWGPAARIAAPLTVGDVDLWPERPAAPLGSDDAKWEAREGSHGSGKRSASIPMVDHPV